MPRLPHGRKAFLRAFSIVTLLIEEEESDVTTLQLHDLTQKYLKMKEKTSLQRSIAAKSRKKKGRVSWQAFNSSLTDSQFRRMFRMSKNCFAYMVSTIEAKVGREKFKSDEFLNSMEKNGSPFHRMAYVHKRTTGGFICGEIKMAITLRMLAGGSYLDLFMLYDVFHTYPYQIMDTVLEEWIGNDAIFPISGKDYLNDEEKMRNVAKDFEEGCRCGAFQGCIGALDGWLVKIKKPSSKDGVKFPGDFFSRKGFYAINVQVLVDRKKRVLYKSILCRGAEHDSSAFKASDLYSLLMEKKADLQEQGLYMIGDSAYSIRSFIIVPYDNAFHGTGEDTFNFYHSSSRIVVECAFGEIDMRWGILWKPLRFSLKKSTKVIDACLRLHNFIVDYRESVRSYQVSGNTVGEVDMFLSEVRRSNAEDRSSATGVFGGEEEQRLDVRRGRPPMEETVSREDGLVIRDEIKNKIADGNWIRPKTNWYRTENRFITND